MKHLIPWLALAAIVPAAHAALIASYTFDSNPGGLVDNSGAGIAGNLTLGSNGSIDTTTATGDSSAGSLRLLSAAPAGDSAGGNGAVSANNLTWSSGQQFSSVDFWVKWDTAATADTNPTMIGLGIIANGGRFDIRRDNSNNNVRLEFNGAFYTYSGVNAFDGSWHRIVVTNVGQNFGGALNNAANFSVTVDGTALTGTAGGTGTNTFNTGTGPLRIGDSINDNLRDFTGWIDNVNLYAVPEPSSAAFGALGLLALLRRRRG